MKTSKLILSSILVFAASSVAFARGGGNGNGNASRAQGSPANPAACVPGQYCDGTGPRCGDPLLCNGTGPCQGTGVPLKDGSGKTLQGRGNPASTGTPLKDGSGKATAPGKGAKDGTGNKANCPNS